MTSGRENLTTALDLVGAGEGRKGRPGFIRHPDFDVARVQLEEEIRHLRKRGRAVEVDRSLQGAPGEEQQVSEVGIVVRVVMGDEGGAKPGEREVGRNHLPGDAVAAVDEVDVLARDDGLRGSRAIFLRTRTASRSQKELRSGLYLELRSGLYLGPSGGAIGILGGLEGPVPCTWGGCSAKRRVRKSRSGSL